VRLATYRKGKAARLGIVWGDQVIDYNAGARLMSSKGKGAARAFADVDLRGFLSQGASAMWNAKSKGSAGCGTSSGWKNQHIGHGKQGCILPPPEEERKSKTI